MGYPIWDVTIGGSVLMALVAITHVIVSHFAVGGGLVLAITETLAVRRNDPVNFILVNPRLCRGTYKV